MTYTKSQEAQLIAENEELKKAIDSSYDGIWICDAEGKTLFINPAIERITGLRKETVIGRNMSDLVKKGVFDKSATIEVIKKKQTVTIMQKVSTGITTIVTGTPIFNNSGELRRIISNVRDITELITLKEKMQKLEAERNRYQSELSSLRLHVEKVNGIVLKSKSMNELVDSAMHVAQYDTTILLQGESGTGKEVMAQLIHNTSPRKESGAFIRVNCSAIPEALLESELFGYEEGAFTGARKQGKPGMFELANNGTLFLDEIGELPLTTQAKFLRVIQEREVMRLGGTKPIKVNVRLITATNRSLAEMVATGEFRPDLFYRLNVVPLTLPPLNQRKEDIPLLVEHFTAQFNEHYQMKKRLSHSAIKDLLDYPWPGNVRELKNIIERAFVTSPNEIITSNELPSFLRMKETAKYNFQAGTLKEEVARFEKELIQSVINKSDTTYEAAELLGINQSTVVRKMKKYQLSMQS